MHISLFDYELPPELIAQSPIPRRDQARMLILRRGTSNWQDSHFSRLAEVLAPGTVVVINNTRVLPARLFARRVGQTGRVEILLLRPVGRGTTWEALGRPARVLREGTQLVFGDGTFSAEVTGFLDGGRRLIQFNCPAGELDRHIDRLGSPPLPPYIKRLPGQPSATDAERYQTIYARHRGAVAAPTAGLHFTNAVFHALKQRHIEVVELTHHVGYATFQPVRVKQIERHQLAAEEYHIPKETAARINGARRQGQAVLAVGTTTVRALESATDLRGYTHAGHGRTDLFIYPGYQFRAIDALLTNFHLPRSSLLMLVCAFAGRADVLRAYNHAIEHQYRFYSYGDCMLIL